MKRTGTLISAAILVVVSSAAQAARVDLQLIGRQGENYFFSVPPSHASDAEYIERFLTAFCHDKAVCIGHVWSSADSPASRFPLSDAQVKAQIAIYQSNNKTKHRKMIWNCKKFPSATSANCFSD